MDETGEEKSARRSSRRSSVGGAIPKDKKRKSTSFADEVPAQPQLRRRSSGKQGEPQEARVEDDASKKVKGKSASISSTSGRRRSSRLSRMSLSGEIGPRRRSPRSESLLQMLKRRSRLDSDDDEDAEEKLRRRESGMKELLEKELRGDEEKAEEVEQDRRKTIEEIQQDEEDKLRGHAVEIGRAVEERDRQYKEMHKKKVGEGWVVDKGKRLTRQSLGLPPKKMFPEKKVKKTVEKIEEEEEEEEEKPKMGRSSTIEPEFPLPKARPSELRRMEKRRRGEDDREYMRSESESSSETSELKEIPVRPLYQQDGGDTEQMSALQQAFKQAMLGTIEEKMVKGDMKLPRFPGDRSLTDVEKLLGFPAVDYPWEEMEGEDAYQPVEELMMTEKALLAQEAYRENQPIEKPKTKKKVRQLSEILHEIEDDFKKLYELVEDEAEGEEEEEEEDETAGSKAREQEGEWDIVDEREVLREEGRALVRNIQRYRGTGFGTNLGDILGWESLRKYDSGVTDLGDEGLSNSEMNFLIKALQQKLAEEKEQNERMLGIMRKRQFRVKQLYDAENKRFETRRSLMLLGDDEDEDIKMLWDYIDDAMIYFRKVERYM